MNDVEPDARVIRFAWVPFFGGEKRDVPYPPTQVWNERLVRELEETKAWILEHRGIRRVHVDGSRRLSAAVAIGFVFSAVAGFTVELVNRGEIWPTDVYETPETPAYSLDLRGSFERVQGARLVVTIGIIRDIVNDVERNLDSLELSGMPTLHLHGAQAIQSPRQLDQIVRKLKAYISRAQTLTGARNVDLFLAGPAPLALFLGHRLNATACIQCYEQTYSGNYVPTCILS